MTISVIITNMPANGGAAITGVDYRINGGAPISLGATGPGTYATVAALGDNVEIRAVNSVGPGPWSAAKNIPVLGFFPALATQAFADNSGNQTYVFPAATGVGLTFTYALTSPPSGVTINSATRTITFDTNAMAPQSGTIITVTATDNLGRAATGSPRTFSLTIGVGAVNPVLDPLTFADPGNATPDTLTAPRFYPGTDTLVAGVVIRNGGTALTAAQVQAGTGTFLERVVIDPLTLANFDLTGFTATSNAGTAIDMAIWEKNNGGLSSVQTVAVSGLDFTAPTFSSAIPADNATNVAVNANLVLTFSENVFPGTGLFRLRNTTANTQIETFNPATGTGSSGGAISIAGAVVTINPFADKLNSTNYALRWDADALRDGDGNSLAANTGDTVYNFTTASGAFDPTTLFTGGREGFLIIPSTSTSFESADNSDPAEIGDGVQFQTDTKGTGTPRNFSMVNLTNRPTLQTSGSGQVLDFEADAEQLMLSGSFTPVHPTDGVTVFARIRLETATGDRHIISSDDGGGDGRIWAFRTNSSANLFAEGYTDTSANRIQATTTATLSTGIWYNVALVFNTTNLRIFIDDMATPSATTTNSAGTVNSSAGLVGLGVRGTGFTPFFDASMGYALCINRSLTTTELQNLATAATARGL